MKVKRVSRMTDEELAEHTVEMHWLDGDVDRDIMEADHNEDHFSGAVRTAPDDKRHTHS